LSGDNNNVSGQGNDSSNNSKTATMDGIPAIVRALLQSRYRLEDLFQTPLVLSTILHADVDRRLLSGSGRKLDEKTAAQIRQLIEVVLQARPQRRRGTVQAFSDYILFQCTEAYSALSDSSDVPPPPEAGFHDELTAGINDGNDGNADADGMMMNTAGTTTTQTTTTYAGTDYMGTMNNGSGAGSSLTTLGGLSESAVPVGAANQLTLALLRCVEVSTNELCRQLAFRAAQDDTSFDVMRLAYSLLTYLTASKSLEGTAGVEATAGRGPSPGTLIKPVNPKLVRAALAAFFDEQNNVGLWDKGQPIFKSFRRQGSNVGNAFVFGLDTLGALLHKLPAEDFRPHLQELQRALVWIEQHQTVVVIADYCDTESGQCYGKPLRGWASPHLNPDTTPQAWSTAQTLTCISRMKRCIRALMHNDVLAEFQGFAYSTEGRMPANWNRLLDSDLGDCGTDSCRTLKEVLQERVLEPFDSSVSNPSFGAAYSAILFGPPGTAKTTICESLARKMGFDFVVIDTSVFLADGLTNVAARIRYVFERLQALENCVILFDEIEEFCLDRETVGIGMESRMLTTAMLTAINDLRRAKRSVFFLATNRLRAFDTAITRPGRFDMQLFVGTPNLGAREIQFTQQLAKLDVSDEVKEESMQSYSDFLMANWQETAMFMNYLEGLQFAAACAKVVVSTKKLDATVMDSILKSQAAVMTVRGNTRDEFTASMGLSRL
jgi:hypothetical protein